jgi:UDP-N-acetylglucosamine diphosphorylase/glucosamine-1-phosphate N-acetyltransferase
MTDWYIKDECFKKLAPLCDLRATFEQRTGGLTTLERLTKKMGCSPSGFLCDDELRAPMIANRTGLSHVTDNKKIEVDLSVIESPWDILDQLPILLQHDLEHAEPLEGGSEVSSFGPHRIDVHSTAILLPGVVLDASQGAIRIEEGAVIRPNAVICGPCWVGNNSTVIDGARIKPMTSIGPWCKIGGEVGGTVFQAFANKSHDGHLGDSVIGEWVNFGAGTTNSNLLNTYGNAIATDLDGKRHRTGRQYVGCFVGDHVKFAIETRIMTGTIIGTGAMVATTQPALSPTPRFAWLTDNGSRTYAIDKFIDVARTVMKRRDRELDSATEAVLRSLASA